MSLHKIPHELRMEVAARKAEQKKKLETELEAIRQEQRDQMALNVELCKFTDLTIQNLRKLHERLQKLEALEAFR